MNLKEKKSKVALCKGCRGYILTCHMDYISKSTEKEFTQLSNDGFEVKIETLEKTKNRNLVFYSDKKMANAMYATYPKKLYLENKIKFT